MELVHDALLWWVEKRVEFPRLSRMALNYLSIPGKTINLCSCAEAQHIPATSVDVERVFSKGRLVLSHVRNRLSVQSTRALMCLGNWSKLGLVIDKDVLQVAKLPDVPEGVEEKLDVGWDSVV